MADCYGYFTSQKTATKYILYMYIFIYRYVYINIALSSHAHTLKVAAQLKSNRVSVGCKDTKPKLKDKATTVRSSARWTNKTAQRLGPNTWLGPQKRQRQNKAKAKAKASKVRRNCAKTGAKWKVFRLELSLLVCRVFLANAFVLASLAYGVCFFLFFGLETWKRLQSRRSTGSQAAAQIGFIRGSHRIGMDWIALVRSALVSQRYIRCIRNGQKRWPLR